MLFLKAPKVLKNDLKAFINQHNKYKRTTRSMIFKVKTIQRV